MIGVVGPADAAEGLVEAISAAVADDVVRLDAAADVPAEGPDLVVAVGERAVSDLARDGVAVPVLAVDAGAGVDSVVASPAPGVVERFLEAGVETRERPVLGVAVDGERVDRGVFEAMLVTSEPSRISEYAVETPGDTDRFRADGVVVTTPAGSEGYVRALEGPVLDDDADGLAVVPVGAFDIRPTVRVVGDDATLSIRVERDEGEISLLVDGVDVGQVAPWRPVTVEVVDAIEMVLPLYG